MGALVSFKHSLRPAAHPDPRAASPVLALGCHQAARTTTSASYPIWRPAEYHTDTDLTTMMYISKHSCQSHIGLERRLQPFEAEGHMSCLHNMDSDMSLVIIHRFRQIKAMPGIILGMGSANEVRRYNITSSLIG